MQKHKGIASVIKKSLDDRSLKPYQRKELIQKHNHHVKVAKGIRENILDELSK